MNSINAKIRHNSNSNSIGKLLHVNIHNNNNLQEKERDILVTYSTHILNIEQERAW